MCGDKINNDVSFVLPLMIVLPLAIQNSPDVTDISEDDSTSRSRCASYMHVILCEGIFDGVVPLSYIDNLSNSLYTILNGYRSGRREDGKRV